MQVAYKIYCFGLMKDEIKRKEYQSHIIPTPFPSPDFLTEKEAEEWLKQQKRENKEEIDLYFFIHKTFIL